MVVNSGSVIWIVQTWWQEIVVLSSLYKQLTSSGCVVFILQTGWPVMAAVSVLHKLLLYYPYCTNMINRKGFTICFVQTSHRSGCVICIVQTWSQVKTVLSCTKNQKLGVLSVLYKLYTRSCFVICIVEKWFLATMTVLSVLYKHNSHYLLCYILSEGKADNPHPVTYQAYDV